MGAVVGPRTCMLKCVPRCGDDAAQEELDRSAICNRAGIEAKVDGLICRLRVEDCDDGLVRADLRCLLDLVILRADLDDHRRVRLVGGPPSCQTSDGDLRGACCVGGANQCVAGVDIPRIWAANGCAGEDLSTFAIGNQPYSPKSVVELVRLIWPPLIAPAWK